jgi:hypothetical protein
MLRVEPARGKPVGDGRKAPSGESLLVKKAACQWRRSPRRCREPRLTGGEPNFGVRKRAPQVTCPSIMLPPPIGNLSQYRTSLTRQFTCLFILPFRRLLSTCPLIGPFKKGYSIRSSDHRGRSRVAGVLQASSEAEASGLRTRLPGAGAGGRALRLSLGGTLRPSGLLGARDAGGVWPVAGLWPAGWWMQVSRRA